jgi:hypothetical protein
MSISPLGSSLPLQQNPYNSRIYSEYSEEGKNYYMLAFTPGYALQASELNEVQELFFLNQNLTQRMNTTWIGNALKLPFWEGLIPLNPKGVTASIPTYSNGNASSARVSFSSGWYLWTDSTSKMSFWIHLDNDVVSTSAPTTTSSGTEYIGLQLSKNIITCCPASECSDIQDPTLRDNSQGNYTNFFTCGAARLGVTFGNKILVRRPTEAASDFYPILKLTPDLTNQTATISFYDGQTVSH